MRKLTVDPFVNYLEKQGKFVYQEEFIHILMKSTGKSKGVIRLYVSAMLLRLKKRGLLIRIKIESTQIYCWGLPEWINSKATLEEKYFPEKLYADETLLPCSVVRQKSKGFLFIRI